MTALRDVGCCGLIGPLLVTPGTSGQRWTCGVCGRAWSHESAQEDAQIARQAQADQAGLDAEIARTRAEALAALDRLRDLVAQVDAGMREAWALADRLAARGHSSATTEEEGTA